MKKFAHIFYLSIATYLLAILLAFAVFPGAKAAEEWRAELGSFRIGMLGGSNPVATARRARPFRDAVEKALGLPAEIFVFNEYATLMDAQSSGRIEYAIYSASAYALAWKLCKCLRPLVVPRAQDGTTGYYSVLIVRASGPKDYSMFANRSVAYSTKNSLSGFVIPSIAMSQASVLKLTQSKLIEVGSAELANQKFLSRNVVGLMGWSSLKGDPIQGYSRGTMRLLVESGRIEGEKLRILWQSEQIPHGPHAIRKNLPTAAIELLLGLLQNLSESDPLAYNSIEPEFGGGFAVASQRQYDKFIEQVTNYSR